MSENEFLNAEVNLIGADLIEFLETASCRLVFPKAEVQILFVSTAHSAQILWIRISCNFQVFCYLGLFSFTFKRGDRGCFQTIIYDYHET